MMSPKKPLKRKPNKRASAVFWWLMIALAGFVPGLFLPLWQYREYGEVSTFNLLLPVTTMALGLLTVALAPLFRG